MTRRMSFLALLLVGAIALPRTALADGPSPADRRAAVANGWIYDDFDAGIAKAKETKQPMMVVLRCPP